MMKTAEDQRTVTAMIVDERGNAKIMNAYEAGRNSVIYGETAGVTGECREVADVILRAVAGEK